MPLIQFETRKAARTLLQIQALVHSILLILCLSGDSSSDLKVAAKTLQKVLLVQQDIVFSNVP